MVEQKRQLMMQNLFGESEEDEKEGIASEPDEIASEQESNPRLTSGSEERNIDEELEVSDQTERKGDIELDSEEEVVQHCNDILYNEHTTNQSSREVVPTGYDREECEDKEFNSDVEPGKHLPTITRNNTDAAESGSDGSEGHQQVDEEEEEEELEDAEGSSGRSPEVKKAHGLIPDSADKLRGVFGDSDEEEEPTGPVTQGRMRSPIDEDTYEKTIRPEDIIRDEDGHYESEEDTDVKHKEKPVGPPLALEIPFRPPPAHSDKMNMIKVSNIFGIDSKPFDPNTFIDEDTFVTDESGSKKRIRLENNTVRWRNVQNKDGTTSYESNARFVRWSDGSLQLLIGNEVLDISVQDQRHDQAHLFLRHGKGILQSQGRLLRKMRFIPSSLTSNSHRLLTALVDSRHKKVYKVKNCVTNIDPEREKEEKEKALNQTIKANEILSRKKEKVNKKYAQPTERTRQLSPGFLEEALDEEEELEYDEPRHSASRLEEELEVEARAEKRILNAKGGRSNTPVKMRQQRPVDFSDSEKEDSAYESSDREEVEQVTSPTPKRDVREDESLERTRHQHEEDDEDDDEEEEESGVTRKEMESEAEEPPPKRAAHRRMAVVYDSDED